MDNNIAPGTVFAGSTHRMLPPLNAPPTPFVREYDDRGRVINCQIQEDFVYGEAQWLIGIEPENSKQLVYEPGQVHLDAHGKTLAAEQGGITLEGGTWLLRDGGLAFVSNDGQIKWSSGANRGARDPLLTFSQTASLAITDRANGSVLWDPTLYLHSHLEQLAQLDPLKPKTPKQWQDHAQVTFANAEPYLSIKTADSDVVFRTSYEWPCGQFDLYAGHYVAIAPAAVRRAPAYQSVNSQDFASPPPYSHADSSRGHHGLSSFVRDVTSSLQQTLDRSTPPAVPPRNSSLARSSSGEVINASQQHQTAAEAAAASQTPAFLFIHPVTHQIVMHTSPSPMHPRAHETIFAVPSEPMPELDDSWLAFQSDGNLVYCASFVASQVGQH